MVAKWEKEWQDKQAKEASEVGLHFLHGINLILHCGVHVELNANILSYIVLFWNPSFRLRVGLHL